MTVVIPFLITLDTMYMMVNNLRFNKIIWTVTTFFVLIASVAGIISPRIYDPVFAKEFIPGALPQDILTFLLCMFTFFLISNVKNKEYKTQAVIIGIIGSFFYLYGIFTIERVYNVLYILYAVIFGSSFWSILYSLMNIRHESISHLKLLSSFAKLSSIIALFIAVLFTFLWIAALIPLMLTHKRIDFLYSIYILDLCFIMPAFMITAVLTLKKNPYGILFLPAVYIVGFFVIFPLGLGEVAKLWYGQTFSVGSMVVSFVFSFIMLIVGILHLLNIKTQ